MKIITSNQGCRMGDLIPASQKNAIFFWSLNNGMLARSAMKKNNTTGQCATPFVLNSPSRFLQSFSKDSRIYSSASLYEINKNYPFSDPKKNNWNELFIKTIWWHKMDFYSEVAWPHSIVFFCLIFIACKNLVQKFFAFYIESSKELQQK